MEIQIKEMETQYDKCCDEKAKADSQGMSEELLALYVCTEQWLAA